MFYYYFTLHLPSRQGGKISILVICRIVDYNESIIFKQEETTMDIKAIIKDKVDEIVAKIKADKNIAAKFQKDPIGTVEGLIGIDLPNDQIEALVEAVKAKITLEKAGEALGGLKGLFGK